MRTRRSVLTVIGAAALAGCSSSTTETRPNSNTGPENEEQSDAQRINQEDISVPLGGLGKYEEKVAEAQPLEEAPTEITIGEVEQILEKTNNVQEEQKQLAQILTTDNKYSVLQAYHTRKQPSENQVVVNQNWSFTTDSEPILEHYTIQNNELQSQPIITDTSHGSITIHKPGDPNPEYLKDIRDDTDAAQLVPQDYDALMDRIEYGKENGGTLEQVEEFRHTIMDQWSAGIFGVDSNPNVIPYDAESSNVVFDGIYHDGDTEAVVQLSNAYAESDLADTDQVVSAEYTGDDWKFRVHEDYEMGERIPGR